MEQEGAMADQDRGMRALGELEAVIMEVVWAHEPVTVRAVLRHLHRTPMPGYTTIATVMNRLIDKGLLRRTRSGKADVYEAAYSRAEFQRRSAAAAVHRLVDEYGEVALAQFAAALESADPDRLVRLREGVGRLEGEDQHE
jgi:predicted transcriptional regulator